MNDLLSTTSSFRIGQPSPEHQVIEMTGVSDGAVNLDKFFSDVETIKEELKEMERLNARLKSSHEKSKTFHLAKGVKELRSTMDADVALALKKAKFIKLKLEAIEHSTAANRSLPDCGPGSSSERIRTFVVDGLKKKLKKSMNSFNDLRQQISLEYRESVKRRYFTVTGENPDDKFLDLFTFTGMSESFVEKAIEEQGRGRIEEMVNEIGERHDGVKELENNLKELHDVFLDMAVLVQSQEEQLDDIESHVARANSFVRSAAQQLHTGRKHQKNTLKWSCNAIIILLIIIIIIIFLLVVIFSLRPWQH